jgi:hypothetical protein
MPTYELLAAYCRTDYRVELPNRNFSIRLGNCSAELDELLAEADPADWAIITADNPRSHQLSESENAERRRLLQRRLDDAASWRLFPTIAMCPQAQWPPEHGQVVVGIPEDDALSLARDFDQHAILWGSIGTRASLRLTAPAAWRTTLGDGLDSDDVLLRMVCQETLAAQLSD